MGRGVLSSVIQKRGGEGERQTGTGFFHHVPEHGREGDLFCLLTCDIWHKPVKASVLAELARWQRCVFDKGRCWEAF